MKEKKQIAGLYLRVSRKDQTLEQQEQILKDYCEKENLEIFEIYKEKISGATTSRKELDRMLRDMRNRCFSVLVVYKFDRLGRSTIHLLQVLEEMKSLGVRLIATSQNIDTSTPMGRLFFTILSGIAELEREMIRERTQNKLDYYKQQIKKKGFFINKKGEKCYSLGRQKGSKDKGRRRRSGYVNRWLKNKK